MRNLFVKKNKEFKTALQGSTLVEPLHKYFTTKMAGHLRKLFVFFPLEN